MCPFSNLCYHLTVPEAIHPYTPSLSLSLSIPSSFPFSPLYSIPSSFSFPLSPFVSLFLFLLRSHFYLVSSSLQHRSAHWNVKYAGANTLFCGQMETERERTLQMKLSKSALKARGKEEGEESSFVVYTHLSPRQWVFLFCSEVSFPGSQGKILRDNYTVRHATLMSTINCCLFICLFVCLSVCLFVCLLSTHCINTITVSE